VDTTVLDVAEVELKVLMRTAIAERMEPAGMLHDGDLLAAAKEPPDFVLREVAQLLAVVILHAAIVLERYGHAGLAGRSGGL
jgi:hypothetical protein